MSIKVDNISTWPKEIVEKLESPLIRDIFKKHECIEHIYDLSSVKEIGAELVASCYRTGLIGYHCTKEKHHGFFEENGLEITIPKKKIDAFLSEFGHKFSTSKLEQIKPVFGEWLNERMHMYSRTGKIWFCLSRIPAVRDGTEYFFKYYGGEIIYWPFKNRDPEVEAILESIGLPVVIELTLEPSELEFFGNCNLARSMLSYYGFHINTSFNVHDIEGYAKTNIHPEKIIKVHPKNEFFKQVKQIFSC